MNNFLVFSCIVAVYASLAEAATNEEIQNAIKNSSGQVRQERMFELKSAIREAMMSTGTPQYKSCVKWHISSSIVGLNQALDAEETAAESEYQALPPADLEQVDTTAISQQLHDRFLQATAPYSKESITSQCA